MNLFTTHPFAEIDALRREIDSVFRAFDRGAAPACGPTRRGAAFPAANVTDSGEEYRVEFLMPGLHPESLNITVQRNTLTVTAERKNPVESLKPTATHRNERVFGTFTRTLSLPTLVDDARARAEYRNGILTITLPKAEAAKPRQIAVSLN